MQEKIEKHENNINTVGSRHTETAARNRGMIATVRCGCCIVKIRRLYLPGKERSGFPAFHDIVERLRAFPVRHDRIDSV